MSNNKRLFVIKVPTPRQLHCFCMLWSLKWALFLSSSEETTPKTLAKQNS